MRFLNPTEVLLSVPFWLFASLTDFFGTEKLKIASLKNSLILIQLTMANVSAELRRGQLRRAGWPQFVFSILNFAERPGANFPSLSFYDIECIFTLLNLKHVILCSGVPFLFPWIPWMCTSPVNINLPSPRSSSLPRRQAKRGKWKYHVLFIHTLSIHSWRCCSKNTRHNRPRKRKRKKREMYDHEWPVIAAKVCWTGTTRPYFFLVDTLVPQDAR